MPGGLGAWVWRYQDWLPALWLEPLSEWMHCMLRWEISEGNYIWALQYSDFSYCGNICLTTIRKIQVSAAIILLSVTMNLTALGTSYNHIVFVLCLLAYSTCTMSSRFIHAVGYVRTSLLRLNNIPLYVYATFYLFICFIDGHLGCFHLSALAYCLLFNAVMNMGVQISVQSPAFTSFGFIPGSGIAGSYGSSILSFLRNHQTVFPGGCTISHSKYTRVPVSPLPYQHLLFINFLDILHPNGYEVVSYCGKTFRFLDVIFEMPERYFHGTVK